ncbi:uncharacterized protein DUF4974 [Dyadobacter jejuensis]|uniref:Uncharacterized protein DUF4974 n=1 Tax=Dyadobacter jejuensis TaxID=1082580 RepID=A0A316AB90_9BACT|nr:FecR family protein [Dyadobacter jejuensis]PWJ55046.1 uncharacterized protein DUF4974 [Dyadobacter jejuensis]
MQQRDRYISVEEFLGDASFKRWIHEDVDSDEWEAWTLENAQRAKLVDEARLWILAMRIPKEQVSTSEISAQFLLTKDKIENKRRTAKLHQGFWLKLAAASIALVTIIGTYYLTRLARSFDRPQAFESVKGEADGGRSVSITKANTTDRPLLVMLSDGSSVLLQPKSKLTFPEKFSSDARKVYLSGDAFFEISKNKKHPFYVFANELVTEVVGTSFRVKAYPNNKNVEVVVRTGKVKVTTQHMEGEEIELLPNEGARLQRNNLQLEKIDDLTQERDLSEELSNIERLSFEFTDVPVLQILKTIEQAYAVEIDYPVKKLDNCYLTTSLSDQPLAEKLKIICESLGEGTTYKIVNSHITIYSVGCH